VTCNAIELGCACDGAEINLGCNGLPDGYVSKPFLHQGACSDASGGDSGTAADAFRRKANRAAATRASHARVHRGSCALPKTAGSPRATSAARAKRTKATAPPPARPIPTATPLKLAGSRRVRPALRKASASPSRSSFARPSLMAALAMAPRSTSPAPIYRADTKPNR
jgi:hypothetical protein